VSNENGKVRFCSRPEATPPIGLQEPFAQGANGAGGGGFDNNTALAVAEGRLHDVRFSQGGLSLYGPSDLGAGDVLLTGVGGLAPYLKTTGDYGHGGVVTDALKRSIETALAERFDGRQFEFERTFDWLAHGVPARRVEATRKVGKVRS